MPKQFSKCHHYHSFIICLTVLICGINAQTTSQAMLPVNESSSIVNSHNKSISDVNTSSVVNVTKFSSYRFVGNMIVNGVQRAEKSAQNDSFYAITDYANVNQNQYDLADNNNEIEISYESEGNEVNPSSQLSDVKASLPPIPSSVNGGDIYRNENQSIVDDNNNNEIYDNDIKTSIIKSPNVNNEFTEQKIFKFNANNNISNKNTTKPADKTLNQALSADNLAQSQNESDNFTTNCTEICDGKPYNFTDFKIYPDYVDVEINSTDPWLCLYLSNAICNECKFGPTANCSYTEYSCNKTRQDQNKTSCKLRRKIGDLYVIGWYGCGDNSSSKCISQLINQNDNANDTNTVLIIIMSVLLPIALCAALCAFICCHRSKKNNCGMKTWRMSVPTKNNNNNSLTHKRVDKVPTDGTAVINMELHSKHATTKSRPIQLDCFDDYYQLAAADSNLKLAEEFELLRANCGRKNSSRISQLSINKPKNRFVNILPYDHSIVRLKTKNEAFGSDYINANFIPGYNSELEYIACQGPMYSTVNDFFRMIIEQNVKIIVMLTQCIEKGRQKCEKYWPSDDDIRMVNGVKIPTLAYDDIRVELEKQVKHKAFTARHLKLIKQEEVKHSVIQYHYSQWPDFGCPQNPLALIHLIEVIRVHLQTILNNDDSEQKIFDSPILVHCSAGVGRSGTFIAVDRIWQMLKRVPLNSDTAVIDIFGTVCDMRKYRPNMVQTEDQYIYIYECVKCLIDKLKCEREDVTHQLPLDDTEISKTQDNSGANSVDQCHTSSAEEDDECQLNADASNVSLNAFENKSFINEEVRETTDL